MNKKKEGGCVKEIKGFDLNQVFKLLEKIAYMTRVKHVTGL